jgi:Zn-dependent peptidase ImmA (M78 family)/DNA-binding XRE family transcriptional regulator
MINGRIARARKAAGLSLRQVAEAIGLSHAAIKKYEDGVVVPSSDVLMKLARALNVRTEYFFRRQDVRLNEVEYRKRKLPKKALASIEHKVLDMVERRLDLESQFPDPPGKTFDRPEELPAVGNIADVEDIAATVRRLWDLGSDPIRDLVDLLESRGIRVYMLNDCFGAKFDGLAASVDGHPVIVVGDDWPGDRQRFTLAHELGHLILHGILPKEIDEEKAANRFAGAFLLPGEALESEIGKQRSAVEWRELGLLKGEYGLSMRAISYRLHDKGIISPDRFQAMQREFSFRGWTKSEPVSFRKEETHAFEQLIFHALAEDYIGESKAAELMQQSIVEFKKLRAMEGDNVATHQ